MSPPVPLLPEDEPNLSEIAETYLNEHWDGMSGRQAAQDALVIEFERLWARATRQAYVAEANGMVLQSRRYFAMVASELPEAVTKDQGDK